MSVSISRMTAFFSVASLPSRPCSFFRSSSSAFSSCSIRMASSLASWRRRISRMSSACRSVSPNACISAGLGSSDSRMMRITSSMFSNTSCRPSRMWMRSSTLPSRCALRRRTVCSRKSIHSCRMSVSVFWRGRLSRPSITRLIDTEVSRLVQASRVFTSSDCSIFEVRGSNTRRTAASRPLSSRTASITFRICCFACSCSGVSAFLPVRTFGLLSSSTSSSTFWADTPCGSSSMTSCHWLRASSSMCQRARTRMEPRPLR